MQRITGVKPQSPENSGETYSAADLPAGRFAYS